MQSYKSIFLHTYILAYLYTCFSASRCLQRPRLVGPKLRSEGRWLNSVYFRAFRGYKFPKMNAIPTPLNTQNKPIFSTLRVAVSNLFLRTKDYRLKTDNAQNKPIQTQTNPISGCLHSCIPTSLCQFTDNCLLFTEKQYNRPFEVFFRILDEASVLKPISEKREYVEVHGKRVIRRGWRTWIHWENLPWLQQMLVHFLKITGLWRRGWANMLNPQVERTELSFANLPAAFDGFGILWMSDFHIEELHGLTESILEKIDGLDYDVCVLGGDYCFAHGTPDEAVTRITKIVSALQAKTAVYAILGNHDFYSIAEVLDGLGVRVLLNENCTLEKDGHSIHLIGVEDCHCYKADDLDEAMAGLNGDGFKVLLSHSPEFQKKVRHSDIDLFICGHTHGGQICLPNGTPVVTGASVPRHCIKGRWQHKSMTGYTSRGAGASGVPVRFNCPGELTLLTLRAATHHEGHEDK